MSYFAYVHARPHTADITGIFYVGKGTLRRAKRKLGCNRNGHYQNIVKKHGEENILVGLIECSTEASAFLLEKGLIKLLKQNGVLLSNQMDGGYGGSSGRVVSEEQRKKQAEYRIGKRHNQEAKIKISAVSKATTARFWANPENRKKASERMIKRFTDSEVKLQAAERMKARWNDPIEREKILAARRGK